MSTDIDDGTKEIIKHFVMESEELLDHTVADILALEENPEDELTNKIFRTFHTIKGNSMMLGFEKLASFLHRAEDFLTKLKESQVPLDRHGINVLLKIADVLMEIITSISHDFNDEDSQVDTQINSGLILIDKLLAARGMLIQTPGKNTGLPTAGQAPLEHNGQLTFLIVEDDALVRSILLEILSPYGNCQVAKDGEEALNAFRKKLTGQSIPNYDLICMDIKMPNMDGIEALKKIRRLEKENGIYQKNETNVIMITGLRDPKTVIESFYRSGATSYLIKPIKPNELERELTKMGITKIPRNTE
ncbi:MAG: response regulator [bacterium]|nr:response regulator [bacterium]